MHYKNGREAKNGDLVIGRGNWTGATIMAGLLIDLMPTSTTCNATLLRPGGIAQTCVTVVDFYHAEDAIEALEAQPKDEASPQPTAANEAPCVVPEPTTSATPGT